MRYNVGWFLHRSKSVVKCTIMYREPRPLSANLCIPVQFDNSSTSLKFMFSRSKLRMKFTNDYLVNGDRYCRHCYCQQQNVACRLSISIYLHLTYFHQIRCRVSTFD